MLNRWRGGLTAAASINAMHGDLMRAIQYDPSATYAARRHVTISGENFERGQVVPRSAAKDERQYRKWWDTHVLTLNPVSTAEGSQGAPHAQPVPKAMAPVVNVINNTADPITLDVNGQAHTIPAANGVPLPASEMLIEATAAKAAAEAPAITDAQRAEGHIVIGGRGWCRIYFQDKEEPIRGVKLAEKRLDEMRVAAGLAPLLPPEEAEPAPLEVVDGETGEITSLEALASAGPTLYAEHTGGETTELPDEDTPSAPWAPSEGVKEALGQA